MENTNSKMSLNLTNRNHLVINGVKKVKSSEPAGVIAVLDNCMIIITGQNLSVENLNVSSGNLEIKGSVSSIKFSNSVGKRFSLKGIFK